MCWKKKERSLNSEGYLERTVSQREPPVLGWEPDPSPCITPTLHIYSIMECLHRPLRHFRPTIWGWDRGAGPHSRILTGVDKPLSRQNTENVLRSQSLYLITSWLLLKIHILFDYSIIPTATLSYCSIHIMHISFSPMYYLARLLKSRLLLHDFRNKVDVHRVSDSFEFASWHINGHWPSR